MFLRRKRERVAPDQEAVVDRALCVAVTAMLGAIAGGVEEGEMDGERAALYVTESHRWLRRENLADALSHRERFLIARPLPQWTAADATYAAWRSESAGVLQWSLSALDAIPPYDTRFDSVPPGVPLLAPTDGFRAAASLRPPEEIAKARGLAESWHWRARVRELDSPSAELDAMARRRATSWRAEGAIPEPVDGDFPAFGTAFRALGADEYAAVASTALERLYALNWLCGYAADWDSVPTD